MSSLVNVVIVWIAVARPRKERTAMKQLFEEVLAWQLLSRE